MHFDRRGCTESPARRQYGLGVPHEREYGPGTYRCFLMVYVNIIPHPRCAGGNVQRLFRLRVVVVE